MVVVMGTYVGILKYVSSEDRELFREQLKGLVEQTKEKPIKYRVFNAYLYEKRLEVELKIKVTTMSLYGSLNFDVEIDVPIEVVHLDGKWDVKEKRKVSLFFYENDNELEDTVLAVSNGTKGVKSFLDAIRYLRLKSPQRMKLRFVRSRDFIEQITKLGTLGWVWLSGVRDRHIKWAGIGGQDLQRAEVVTDLLRRGAFVSALVVENPRKGIKIIISDKGAIYSQRNLRPHEIAAELKELIKFFKSSKLFTFE